MFSIFSRRSPWRSFASVVMVASSADTSVELACHFSAPLRHAEEVLQRRQTRLPAHALGNGDRQIRHLRIFSSTIRSGSCASCRRTTSVSSSSSKGSASGKESHVSKLVRALDELEAFGGICTGIAECSETARSSHSWWLSGYQIAASV